MRYGNLFYFRYINDIGGIESWYYYISRLYNDYDITILYVEGNATQIERLRQKVRVIQWDKKQRFECDKLFINFNSEIIDFVETDNVTFFIHGDYADMLNRKQVYKADIDRIISNKRINEIVAVSKNAQKAFEQLTGRKVKLCYNPVALQPPKRLVRLVSAQRMTAEKGMERMRTLSKALDKYCEENDVKYQWDIYTNSQKRIENKNLVYREPDIEVNRVFGNYDYFVALSDNEGYCYSAVEALMRGTKAVVTPCPVFKEIGLNASNSIQLEFDCSNVDEVAEKILEGKRNVFNYSPPKTTLDKFLVKKASDYNYEKVTLKCIVTYSDLQLGRTIKKGEVYSVGKERADLIIKSGYGVKVNVGD